MALLLLLTIIDLSCARHIKSEDILKSTKEYELPGPQWKAWNTLKEQWMRENYWQILKVFDLEMSCSGCEYIYLDVILDIDLQGRIRDISILRENVCGETASPEFRKAMLEHFRTIVFPPELRGWKIKAKLGTGLKC